MIYIDKGNEAFRRTRNSEYIDKSGLIAVVNQTLFTEKSFTCVTRSRRFGKSMAAKMLAAYYDRSCDSRSLFADLKIAQDPTFEEHLNKYPVISIDLSDFVTRKVDREIMPRINSKLIQDINNVYPQVPTEEDDDLMEYLIRINAVTGDTFIFIIDEWDAILRECAQSADPVVRQMAPLIVNDYVNWLRRMFKAGSSMQVFAGVYMTGILPIKKYKTESALNNFLEYSMVEPRKMATFFGFTKEEVQGLAAKHGMDFDELEKWYDGYQIGPQPSMFNPNSVMQAIDAQWCRSYWAGTGSFEAVTGFIDSNFDGLRDDIVEMLAGGRAKVDPTGFQNDLAEVHSRDDVLTVLIHLGYLSFDRVHNECYIPNKEVAGEMVNAVKANKWKHVVEALSQSERLLQATLRGDADTVARMLEQYHSDDTSILSYNDENSLSCVISLAYYYARNDYYVIREMPTGKGYADVVLLPRKNVTTPALVVELKKDKDAQAAIAQIKERHYPQLIEKYTGDILLVGISYDRKTKEHQCQIETWHKEA